MFDDEKIKLMDIGTKSVWIQMLLSVKQSLEIEGQFFTHKRWLRTYMSELMLMKSLGMVEIKRDHIVLIDFERYAKIDRSCIVKDNNMADLRKVVFERDNFTCCYCKKTEGPFEADHVLPKSRGGTTTLDNLVCACMACNRSKKTKHLPNGWGCSMWHNAECSAER